MPDEEIDQENSEGKVPPPSACVYPEDLRIYRAGPQKPVKPDPIWTW